MYWVEFSQTLQSIKEYPMRLRQTCIATFEAKPGMRLARPIIKVFNQRLFQLLAGTELTEDHIRQIVVRGIHPTEIAEKFWGA
jgi:hypothetical protein